MKRTIHLKERELKRMITESVIKVLYESRQLENYLSDITDKVFASLPFYVEWYEGKMVADSPDEPKFQYRFKTAVEDIEEYRQCVDALDKCDEITIAYVSEPREEDGYDGLTFMTQIYKNDY